MPRDPAIHNRRSIRLPTWDYRTPTAYFVTVCTYQRQIIFDNERFRQMAEQVWRHIISRSNARKGDEFVVMPNHVHGIVWIMPRRFLHASLATIVGSFKSSVARRINETRGTIGEPVWQRGYFERVIRNDRELDLIRRYIRDNPRRWADDKYNPLNAGLPPRP